MCEAVEWKEARGDGERERGCSSYIDFTSRRQGVECSGWRVWGDLGGLEKRSLQQAEV